MQAKTKFFDLTYILLVPFILSAFIPAVNKYFRILYTFPFFILFYYLSPAIQKNYFKRSELAVLQGLVGLLFPAVLLFGGFGLVYKILKLREDFSLMGQGAYMIAIVCFILLFYNAHKYYCYREVNFINVLYFTSLIIATLFSIRAELYFGGGASRVMTGMSSENVNIYSVRDAFDLSAAGYSHVYGVGLLMFPLLYISKYYNIHLKLILWLSSMLFLILAYLAMYSILILSLLVAGSMYFFAKLGASKKIIITSVILLIVIFSVSILSPTVLKPFSPILSKLEKITNNEIYKFRLISIIDHISGSSYSYAYERTSLYVDSWNCFVKYPFFGIYAAKNSEPGLRPGGHSFILDGMGQYGFPFLVVLVLFIVKYYYFYTKLFFGPYRLIWFRTTGIYWVQFLFIALLNPMHGYVFYFSIFFFIPAIIYYLQRVDALEVNNVNSTYQLRYGSY